MKAGYRSIICIILICGMAFAVLAAGAVPSAVLEAKESVVRVEVEYADKSCTGSGFVIQDEDGTALIVTNYHVVEGETKEILVWVAEKEKVTASILAFSEQQDLCILKLSSKGRMDALALAVNGAKQGEAVYAVGFPAADSLSDSEAHFGAEATITDGIVSAIREATISQYEGAVTILQISAAINAGNSGGPLFNSKGEVVGINTYGVGEAQGIFGAISVTELQRFLASQGIRLRETGERNARWLLFAAPPLLALGLLGVLFVGKHRKRKKEKANIPMSAYMGEYANGLGENGAVSLLFPVALQLRNIHREGRVHLQVAPDRILVHGGVGQLQNSTNAEADRFIGGYAAPEVYLEANIGVQADIYSFCALLFFAATGKRPQNAIQRGKQERAEAEEILKDTSCSDAFIQILQKGMRLHPEERFATMDALITEIAPFYLGEPVESTNEKAEKEKPSQEKDGIARRKRRKLLLAGAVLLVLISVGGYCLSYYAALNSVKNGDYEKAERQLFLPQITKLHDRHILPYLRAARALREGRYNEAKECFASLSGYYNSDDLEMEAEYRLALQYAEKKEFEQAESLLQGLAEKRYGDAAVKIEDVKFMEGVYLLKDRQDYESAEKIFIELERKYYSGAGDMKKETQYRWALSLIEEQRYPEAFHKLNHLQGYGGVKSTLSKLKPVMYNAAQSDYWEGNYTEARDIFKCISSYREASKYLALISARINADRPRDVGSIVSELKDIMDFEDTAEVIQETSEYLKQFLRGRWETKGGRYYFELKENNGTTYNLPWYEGDTYSIQDGVYYIHSGTDIRGERAQFKFYLISVNCMDVYCYADDEIYRLFRK